MLPPPPRAAPASAAQAALTAPGLHKNYASESAAAGQLAAAAAHLPANVGLDEAGALGAGKATVYRDRKGRKLEMLSEMMKSEGAPAGEPVKPSWGKGLAQQRSKEEQRERDRKEAAKPLARYEIDDELDAQKRAVMRFDDPMAQHLTRKAPVSNKPRYRGPPPPPNRFDLPPGHRWDGVDRSNGYEKQFFQAHALARRQAATAHAWATEDM